MQSAIAIASREDLLETGPVQANLNLQQHLNSRPRLNLLYTMKLALEDRSWSSLTRQERVNLIMEIEAWHELQAQTASETEYDE